jgi:peptidoglycan/xylan/chitin deacetylase (PgdA/CDA1 family)
MAGRSGAFLTSRSLAMVVGPFLGACLAAVAPVTTQYQVRRDDQRVPSVAGGPSGATSATNVSIRTYSRPTHDRSTILDRPLLVSRTSPVDCRTKNCVALTFDDGPAASTTRLLDTLAAHGARATFFLVGRSVEKFPELVRREVVEGHELGNHTYTHANLRRSSPTKVTAELRRTQEAIRRVTGITPGLMRPPFGATDEQVTTITRRLNLAQILWSLDPRDWRDRDAEKVEDRVVNGVRKGSIVLMHDIHPTTVAAVPGILRRLTIEGYSFVTVSELYGSSLVPGEKYAKR